MSNHFPKGKRVPVLLLVALIASVGFFISCNRGEEGETILNGNTKLPEENSNLDNVEFNGDSLIFLYDSRTDLTSNQATYW